MILACNTTELSANSHAHTKTECRNHRRRHRRFRVAKETNRYPNRGTPGHVVRWQNRGNHHTGSAHTEAQGQCRRPSPYGRGPEEKMGSNKGGISRSRNQRPDRNPQNPSGRSVPLAGVPFPRLRSVVGRSNEPKLRRRSQPAPRKLQHKRPLPRKLRKRLRRNRRRRLPPRPDRSPRRKLLLSRLTDSTLTFPWETEAGIPKIRKRRGDYIRGKKGASRLATPIYQKPTARHL